MADEDQTKNAPSPNTAFQPGGVKARDAARRDIAKEMDSIRRMKKLDSQINRAIRRGNPKKAQQFSDLKKAMGGNPFDTAGGNIANVADTRSQARVNYNEKAEKRFKMGQKEAADAVEPAPVPENLNNGVDGKPVPETQQPYTVGQAKPSEQSPILPNPADELEESVFEKDAREAQERSTESGAFGDQKKQEALGEKFGPGARDTKQEFLDDLEGSDLIKASRGLGEGDPNSKEIKNAQEKAYKRADELDITREELQEKMGWETDREVAQKADKKSKAEQKQRISDEVDAEFSDDKFGIFDTSGYEETEKSRRDAAFQDQRDRSDSAVAAIEAKEKKAGVDTKAKIASEREVFDAGQTTKRKINAAASALREDYFDTAELVGTNRFDSTPNEFTPHGLFGGDFEREAKEAEAKEKGSGLRHVQRAKNTADSFNRALGGEDRTTNARKKTGQTEFTSAYNPFTQNVGQGETRSTPTYGESKRVDYTSNAFRDLKRMSLGFETDAVRSFLSGAEAGKSRVESKTRIASAQNKIIKAALDTGYPIEKDTDLMKNPDFVKRYKEAKIERKDRTKNALAKEIEAIKPAQLQ